MARSVIAVRNKCQLRSSDWRPAGVCEADAELSGLGLEYHPVVESDPLRPRTEECKEGCRPEQRTGECSPRDLKSNQVTGGPVC